MRLLAIVFAFCFLFSIPVYAKNMMVLEIQKKNRYKSIKNLKKTRMMKR